jgi:hypothetical protein
MEGAMKEIIVHNQKELDEAVKVKEALIIIKDTTEWFSVSGNSTVAAYGNSTVTANGNSTVTAHGNSTVAAYDNSTVTAHGNSTVAACGNSTVRAYDNSTVRAYDNSTVAAYDNSVTIEAFMLCVIIMIGCICKIKKESKTATIIKNKVAEYEKTDFIDIYGTDENGYLTLYKSVNPDTLCDFYSGKIRYEGTVKPGKWNPDPNVQCGDGLHLSPLPEMALRYNQGKLLVCKVHKNDFVVYPFDITKVRCKKVTVIGEYKP